MAQHKLGYLGSVLPVVSINNYTFSFHELVELEIHQTGFLPSVSLRIKTSNGTFRAKHAIGDGDLVSVFIRPDVDIFKPIRCDFVINHTSTNVERGDNEGVYWTWDILGYLNVPLLNTEIIKAFHDKTSFEVLLDFSKEIGLGFVSNIENTEDKMNWICNKSKKDFIKDVSSHAYLNTESFFKTWIDWYYQLNFQEVNTVISQPIDHDLRIGIFKGTEITDVNSKENQYVESSMILTNDNAASMTNMYISDFSFKHNAGAVNASKGYNTRIRFYDETLRNIEVIEMMALKDNSKSATHRMGLGRVGEEYYKEDFRNYWLGKVYNKSNIHLNYHIAELQNEINTNEMDKQGLRLTLPNVNFNIYRGMMLPLRFMAVLDPDLVRMSGHPEDRMVTTGFGVDRSLSGMWYVDGVSLIYKQHIGKISMFVDVVRREYEMPLVNKYSFTEDPLNYTNLSTK